MGPWDVAVVGAGRVGTALGVLLARAGHRIVGASGREPSRQRVAMYLPGVPFLSADEVARNADVVLVAVPDDAIAPVVSGLVDAHALRAGAWVVHLSGAARIGVMAPARAAGARPLGFHPLQTFPDVDRALTRLDGCVVAVTAEDDDGSEVGERLARDIGAAPFRLADELRPLYHAAAVFASNYVVATSALAVRLLAEAGVPDAVAAMAPLQRATLENVHDLGPAAALTGPAVRGDAGTIAGNLDALASHAPDAVAPYVAMAWVALDVAVASGRLDVTRRPAVEEVLARWT
jgi:predicted short-subunit dehydrogenase-like oxidoreductase (DUF2520 family)